MTNIQAEEIAAKGKQIVLANGNAITLRYSFGAISVIEKEYGSAKKFAEVISDPEGKTITTLGFGLWAGTERKIPFETFLDLLDVNKIQDYAEAFAEAFAEAMGSLGGNTQGEEQPAVAG